FAGRGSSHMVYSGNPKAALDAKLPAGMPPWTIPHLRPTPRSPMSPAGVRPRLPQPRPRAPINGGEGRPHPLPQPREKADALQRLAALIDGVVHPRANVVSMAKGKRR